MLKIYVRLGLISVKIQAIIELMRQEPHPFTVSRANQFLRSIHLITIGHTVLFVQWALAPGQEQQISLLHVEGANRSEIPLNKYESRLLLKEAARLIGDFEHQKQLDEIVSIVIKGVEHA